MRAAPTVNPYDELPYRSLAIEWSAPERLALASLLHGGPRVSLHNYRVLELGCGDGANLLPLAYYRRHATFVGVDGSTSAIAAAEERRRELGLANVQLLEADFRTTAERLDGPFDFIIAHGVFSWVSAEVRDALFSVCAAMLAPGGLLYLNYNTRPGWNVRGMVRDWLQAETADAPGLRARAERAQQLAALVAGALAASSEEHPYTRLMANEFRNVSEHHPSYVAHEYLAPENHAYWRSEFLALAARQGLTFVADADFNYASGRVSEDLAQRIHAAGLDAQPAENTVDLLCFRQLHSPILTRGAGPTPATTPAELAGLIVASCLTPQSRSDPGPRLFRHASGLEVEARDPLVWTALERLRPLWPRGQRLGELFPLGSPLVDDVRLLHRHGLLDLRVIEPADFEPAPGPLNQRERQWHGHATSAYHVSRVWSA
jgi:cyclopropane fatty-acyl-phospholipid synthase-like methyltransferase